MKKSLIFVGMLSIGFAYAQEGNVGINTDQPKATLDIQPNATNLAGTTNEGILAPRLSKDRIAKIATPVEGTLVYATDNVYAGTDTKVAKITEKGYYFYNGTEWVKTSATDSGEWVHNGTDAIVAKRAKDATKSNIFEILDNGSTYINQGNVDWTMLKDSKGLTLFSANPRGHELNVKHQSSTYLPTTSIIIDHDNTGAANYTFNSNRAFVEANHVNNAQGTRKLYQSSSESLIVDDNITSPLYYVRGKEFHTYVGNKVSADIEFIRGISSTAIRGGSGRSRFSAAGYFSSDVQDNAIVTFGEAVRGNVNIKNGGTINNMVGGRLSVGVMKGNTTNAIGVLGEAITYQDQVSNISKLSGGSFNSVGNSSITIGEMSGVSGHVEIRGNTSSQQIIGGNFSTQLNNSTEINLVKGVQALHMLQETPSVSEMIGVRSGIIKKAEATSVSTDIKNYYGFTSENLLNNDTFNGKITNYYDYFAKDGTIAKDKIVNHYGFYINGINKTNYLQGSLGIGTNTPSEKLEVDGKIKASSLAQSGAGDRVVYADENGVLKTGVSAAANVKLATANNVECTEANTGTMNFGSVTINGKATEAFGFCMKNSTGEYKWYYIYGGAGITTGSGAFGSNL